MRMTSLGKMPILKPLRRPLPMAVTLGWHDAVRIPDLRIIGLSQQAFFRRSCCPEHREEQCAEATPAVVRDLVVCLAGRERPPR